jgi:hypothetical protein
MLFNFSSSGLSGTVQCRTYKSELRDAQDLHHMAEWFKPLGQRLAVRGNQHVVLAAIVQIRHCQTVAIARLCTRSHD